MEEKQRCITNFKAMSGPELLAALGDDATLWAEAFCQIAKANDIKGIDQGWMTTWFANAIEHSTDVRNRRGLPQTTPYLDYALNPDMPIS